MRLLRLGEKIDLMLNSKVTLRIYADSQPHIGQTASLQKGAILVRNGTELIEEGLGIGVPVCSYRDGTRFSLDADTLVDDSETGPTVIKIYDMNGIAARKFRGSLIRRGSYRARLLKLMESGYRRLHRFGIEATVILNIFGALGMRNEYLESPSKGRITVKYSSTGRGLKIGASLEGLLSEGLEGLVFTNEEGGSVFREYVDSTGIRLRERQIEPWQKAEAEWASLHSKKYDVSFRVSRPTGWLIVRGREVARGRISWSGLDLFSSSVPTALEYSVEIVGGIGD
jgi:hypothetical protein